jgi:hypothetical protein
MERRFAISESLVIKLWVGRKREATAMFKRNGELSIPGKADRCDGESLWRQMSPLPSRVTAQPCVRIFELLEQVAGHRLDLRAQFQLGQPFFRDRPDA